MFYLIANLYGPFFDLAAWREVVTSWTDWSIIFSVILLECLLSVDNAVVLAAQTQNLSQKKQQTRALLYGLRGSYLLRFLMIGIGTFMIHIWEVKLAGSLYLIYLVINFFHHYHQKRTNERVVKLVKNFWSVVWQMVFMDAIFSVDSIIAALAILTNPIIVLLGGLVGILMIRGVTEIIMKLMQSIPKLEPMAYFLIAIIAVKLFMTISQMGIEIPASLFLMIVTLTIGATLLIHYLKRYSINK